MADHCLHSDCRKPFTADYVQSLDVLAIVVHVYAGGGVKRCHFHANCIRSYLARRKHCPCGDDATEKDIFFKQFPDQQGELQPNELQQEQMMVQNFQQPPAPESLRPTMIPAIGQQQLVTLLSSGLQTQQMVQHHAQELTPYVAYNQRNEQMNPRQNAHSHFPSNANSDGRSMVVNPSMSTTLPQQYLRQEAYQHQHYPVTVNRGEGPSRMLNNGWQHGTTSVAGYPQQPSFPFMGEYGNGNWPSSITSQQPLMVDHSHQQLQLHQNQNAPPIAAAGNGHVQALLVPESEIVQDLPRGPQAHQPKHRTKRKMPKECARPAAVPEQNERHLREGLDFSPVHSLVVRSIKDHLAKAKNPDQFNRVCFEKAKSEHECILGPVKALFDEVHPDCLPLLRAMIIAVNNGGGTGATLQRSNECIWMKGKLIKVSAKKKKKPTGNNDFQFQRNNLSPRIHGLELQNVCLLFMVVRHEQCGVNFGKKAESGPLLLNNGQCSEAEKMKEKQMFCANPYHYETPETLAKAKEEQQQQLIAPGNSSATLQMENHRFQFVWKTLLRIPLESKFPNLDKIVSTMQNFTDQYILTQCVNLHIAHSSSRINVRNETLNCRECIDSIAGEGRLLLSRHDELDGKKQLLLHDFMLLASLLCTGRGELELYDDFNLKRLFVFFTLKLILHNDYERACKCGTIHYKSGQMPSDEHIVHWISNFLCNNEFTPPLYTDPNSQYPTTKEICPSGRVKCVNYLRKHVFSLYMNISREQDLCKRLGFQFAYRNAECICGYFSNNCTTVGGVHALANWMVKNGLIDLAEISRGVGCGTYKTACPAGRLQGTKEVLEYMKRKEKNFEEIKNPSNDEAYFVFGGDVERQGFNMLYFGYPSGPVIAGCCVFLNHKDRRFFKIKIHDDRYELKSPSPLPETYP